MTDMSGMINVQQQQNKVLTALLAAYQAGLVVQPIPAAYAVAALPASAANGQWAYATNGRKPGEGGGSGTGVPVFFNTPTSTWFSYCSGAVVTS
jgi:hypothetical protein